MFSRFGRRREFLDVVTYSMVRKSTSRLVIDLGSLKRIDGVPCYKAKIIYSNDPVLAERVGDELNIPLETFNLVRESVVHEVPSGNGFSMIWFTHGRFDVEKNIVRYIPEYSKNAMQMIFIDLDLTTQVVYTPDASTSIIEFFTIESSPEAKLPERFKMSRSDLPPSQYLVCEVAVKPLKTQVYCGRLIVREDLKIGDVPLARFVRGFTKSELRDLLAGVGAIYALKTIAQTFPEYQYDVSEIIEKVKRPLITLRDQLVACIEMSRDLAHELTSAVVRAETADIRAISMLREASEKYGLDFMSLLRIREELKPREKPTERV